MAKKRNFKRIILTTLMAVPLAYLFAITVAVRFDGLNFPKGVELPFGWETKVHTVEPGINATKNALCTGIFFGSGDDAGWPLLSSRNDTCESVEVNRLAGTVDLTLLISFFLAAAYLFIYLIRLTHKKLVDHE